MEGKPAKVVWVDASTAEVHDLNRFVGDLKMGKVEVAPTIVSYGEVIYEDERVLILATEKPTLPLEGRSGAQVVIIPKGSCVKSVEYMTYESKEGVEANA